MTRYMLDTNIISDLIKNPRGKAAKRIPRRSEKMPSAPASSLRLNYATVAPRPVQVDC